MSSSPLERAIRSRMARFGFSIAAVGAGLLGVVCYLLWDRGAGLVPAAVVGGAVGELLAIRSQERRLKHDPAAHGVDDLDPREQSFWERAARAYDRAIVAAGTLPYFAVLVGYGLVARPWPMLRHEGDHVLVGAISLSTVAFLVWGLVWIQVAWALGRE